MTFERVYTVDEYFDGPRAGVAALQGRPYQYRCEWDAAKDDFSEAFSLTPVDSETLSLVLEKWAIWRSWEMAFNRGEVAQSTHPGFPGRHMKYEELNKNIEERMGRIKSEYNARAVFRPVLEQPELPRGMMKELEVEWCII